MDEIAKLNRPLKVVVVHNYYRSASPSGEDVVYEREKELLGSRGIEVAWFERRNDDISSTAWNDRVKLGMSLSWSSDIYSELGALLDKMQPDLVHVHNTFPLITAAAYTACKERDVPVVQTLHNFRLICANGMLFRNGRICEDCVGESLAPALIHRCYRRSISATGAVVWMLVRNRKAKRYQEEVSRYIALTKFAKQRFVAGGLPADKIRVKPNFVGGELQAGDGEGGYALYVGRLSGEKGVQTLINAWGNIGLRLIIVGDGPARATLEDTAARGIGCVEFIGLRNRQEVLNLLRGAKFLIVPSLCYEGFPAVVVEAYACGTPVVASRVGSLDEIVKEGETGVKFEPGNSENLAQVVRELLAEPDRLKRMRRRARLEFESKYTAKNNFEQLMAIYWEAIEDARKKRPK